jgi:aminoglycoside 6-adenylyltransferase
MRTPDEIHTLILDTARQDDRIRAVILNGSRVNPRIPPDPFQDFDVVYIVTELTSFVVNPGWISVFGELMILQTPDRMGDQPPNRGDSFAYLMQFTDGNRIDLTLVRQERVGREPPDSLSMILLDKDGRLPPFPPPSEASYFPKPPTAKAFADCCNEFWWVAPYVAKALWRGQPRLAHHYLETILRVQLMQIMTWAFGSRTGFARNPGKAGAHFDAVFSTGRMARLMDTYAVAEENALWDALMTMTTLFRETALETAQHHNLPYPDSEDARVSAFLDHVRQLPGDAETIY